MSSFYHYNRDTQANKVILAHYFYWFTIRATIMHKHYQILTYNNHNHKRIIQIWGTNNGFNNTNMFLKKKKKKTILTCLL